MKRIFLAASLAIGLLAAGPQARQSPAPQPPPPSQQPSEIGATISGDGGGAPRLAVPDFIPINKDAETVAVARTIGQVLWDDLNYEKEFTFIPRDVYASVPAATSFNDVPFDRWRELNADGVIVGTVEKVSSGFKVEMKMFNVRSGQAVYPRQYSGSNPRLFAHTISDEIHKTQRALNGVARSKLVFDSDRDGERMTGTVQDRHNKEIYISDYDGENQQRVTVGKTLNISPRWSPNGRSIAYTSYRHGGGQIFISNIFQATIEEVTKGDKIGENWLPAWSPDGTRVAFTSTRDGNPEIYVANRDGSNVKRLTNNPAIDITPTWSPSGTQIAFTSDRAGAKQIYVVSADGIGTAQRVTTEAYCDRATWSPAPYNEIAYASQNGPGFDIHLMDLATRHVTALTFGEGTNESPAFSPNGRHIAFVSTRAGKAQIFTISRDGKNPRQITKAGNNEMPDWSKLPETRP